MEPTLHVCFHGRNQPLVKSGDQEVARARTQKHLRHFSSSTEQRYCGWVGRYSDYVARLRLAASSEKKPESFLNQLARPGVNLRVEPVPGTGRAAILNPSAWVTWGSRSRKVWNSCQAIPARAYGTILPTRRSAAAEMNVDRRNQYRVHRPVRAATVLPKPRPLPAPSLRPSARRPTSTSRPCETSVRPRPRPRGTSTFRPFRRSVCPSAWG